MSAAQDMLRGRPARLTVLDYGLFRVHANRRIIGICGFLVQTDAGESILIDGGFPAHYADDIAGASAADDLASFGEILSLTPANLPAAQLARAGVAPGDISHLILTHGHIDHIGALFDFPQAPLLVSAAERALPRPLYFGDRRPLDWPDRETILIERDTRLGPGFDILMAPGHTPGQIALLLDLPETGAVLLTSDAISRPAEIEEGFNTAPDPAAAQASAARLTHLARDRGALVIYGHDPAQWPILKKAPEAYT